MSKGRTLKYDKIGLSKTKQRTQKGGRISYKIIKK